MTAFKAIAGLLGLQIDSEAVKSFLAANPNHKIDKPSDGTQHATFKQDGIEFSFSDRNMGVLVSKRRILNAVFFYNGGVDKYKMYVGDLPLELSLTSPREELLKKITPSYSWVIGEGKVSPDHPSPDHDAWEFDGLKISAHYDRESRKTKYFTLSKAQ